MRVDTEGMTGTQRQQALRIMAELARRQSEALTLYKPMPTQEAFHASRVKERLVYGGNRSGKTLAAAVEVARAVSGRDPFQKYPVTDGRVILVGKDLRHIGKVMYAKLFRAGAMRMIRDMETGDWREYRPWEPSDAARKAFSKPTPPLIPRRMIRSISWEKKADNIPSTITLKNDWEMTFMSSLGKPIQGIDVDLVWLDEEIVESDWYAEMQARVIDRSGRIIWSAAPQMATEQLYELHERAEEDAGMPMRTIEEFKVEFDGNVYLHQEDKDWFVRSMSEDKAAVRVHGGWAIEGYKVFHNFYPKIHMADPFPVPPDWCRYLFVDPGTQTCGVLSLVVPPPEDEKWKGMIVAEEELYIKRCSAKIFGRAVGQAFANRPIQAQFIDPKSARVVEIGAGRSIHEQYADAMRENKVSCVESGHNFSYGSSDVQGGINALKALFEVRPDGRPGVVIFMNCQNLKKELEKYHHRMLPSGEISDEPVAKRDHLIWCLRAAASYTCPYRKPRLSVGASGVFEAFKRKMRRKREAAGAGEGYNLGPPSWRSP